MNFAQVKIFRDYEPVAQNDNSRRSLVFSYRVTFGTLGNIHSLPKLDYPFHQLILIVRFHFPSHVFF